MPVGGAAHCQKAHRERTCVYDANAAAFEKVKKINEFVVAQAVMAEVQNALNRAFGRVLDNPFQVLELQVGNANVADHALLAQLNQRGKCLIDNLLQTARQSRLKLNIVHVDNVDIINIEPFHTLKNAVVSAAGRIVPSVHAVFSVAAHLCRKNEFVARNLFKCLSQNHFRLQVAVVWRHIDKVDSVLNRSVHRTNAVGFVQRVENAAQTRRAKAQSRQLQARFSKISLFHLLVVISFKF